MDIKEAVGVSDVHPVAERKKEEFMMISIKQIVVKDRIRTDIDREGDSFDGLVESIRRKGVLEPIILTESGDSYELLCGERRLRACERLGITEIPARILDQALKNYDRLEIELIENLFRRDLNPINEANGYRRYFEERLSMNLDEAIKNVILYGWNDPRAQEEVVEGVSTLVKFSGKSSRSIQKLLKLLKLPAPIQEAIESGQINAALADVFVSKQTHPMIMTFFNECRLGKPMTKDALLKKFEQYDRPKKKVTKQCDKLFNNAENIRRNIEKYSDFIELGEAEKLLKQFKQLCQHIEVMINDGDFMTQR